MFTTISVAERCLQRKELVAKKAHHFLYCGFAKKIVGEEIRFRQCANMAYRHQAAKDKESKYISNPFSHHNRNDKKSSRNGAGKASNRKLGTHLSFTQQHELWVVG